MKKLFLSIGVLATLFSACKKESVDSPTPSADPTAIKPIAGVNGVPLTFTKKVLIESFTGASYNLCPEADAMVNSLTATYPDKVLAVSIHEGDKMEIPGVQNYHFRFNNSTMPSVPSFMVNRLPVWNNVFQNMQQLNGNVLKGISTPVTCGLAINSTMAGRTAKIAVHAGFNQTVSGQNHLTVYIIENNVSKAGKGYDQLNKYNTMPSSSFYNMGNPIIGYVHQNVWRMNLTPDLGNPIDPSKCVKAGHEIQNFQVDFPNYIDLNQVYILAFINKVGANSVSHEILNAQIAKLNSLKNWD